MSPRFASYDNRQFAVVLEGHVPNGPLRGTACFERDEELGNVLRIIVDGDPKGNPVIVVRERYFTGRILPDDRYGCDYCLRLANDRNDAAMRPGDRTGETQTQTRNGRPSG